MPDTTCNALPWEKLVHQGAVPVILLRHAQTSWNRERRLLGRSDIPLDAEGQAQARALADWLRAVPLGAIYASPLQRAMKTAAAVADGRPLTVEPVEGLVELDQGELDGQLSANLLDRYADFFAAWREDPATTRLPGGETLLECQDRAWAALQATLSRHQPGPPVLVVVHQMVLSSLLCRALDLPLRQYSAYSQRNTAVNLLAWSSGRLRVETLNVCDHLPEAPPPRRLAV